MNCMVTVTHMNNVPEIRAAVRGGPFARPTEEDKIAHLLTRIRKDDSPLRCADHPVEHVLSYQRRVHAIKKEFLTRGKQSPLGLTIDYADRTEVPNPVACAQTCFASVHFALVMLHYCLCVCVSRCGLWCSVCLFRPGSTARCVARAHPRVVQAHHE